MITFSIDIRVIRQTGHSQKQFRFFKCEAIMTAAGNSDCLLPVCDPQ